MLRRRAVSFAMSCAVLLVPVFAASSAYADEPAPTTLTYTGPAAVVSGREATFGAEVRDGAGDLLDTWGPVYFQVRDGATVVDQWSAWATEQSGVLSLRWRVHAPAGDYELHLAFPGGGGHAAAELVVPLSVDRVTTTLSFVDPPAEIRRTEQLAVALHLAIPEGDAIVGGPAEQWLHVELLDGNGDPTLATDSRLFGDQAWGALGAVSVPPGEYTLRATFAGTGYAGGSVAEVPLEVLRPLLAPTVSVPGGIVQTEPAFAVNAFVPGPDAASGRPDPAGTEFIFRLLHGSDELSSAVATVSENYLADAELPLAGATPGDYQVEVTASGGADWAPYAETFPLRVWETEARIAYTYDGPASPRAGDRVTMTYRLTRADDGTPLAGQPLQVSLWYVGVGPSLVEESRTTDADGRVTVTSDLHGKAGYYHPFAAFDGAGLVGSGFAATQSFHVDAGTATLAITAPATVPYLGSAAPSVTLTEGPGRPVANAPVALTLTDPSGAARAAQMAVTDVSGRVSLPATAFDTAGTWRVSASYAGSAWLPATTATADVVTADVATALVLGGAATGRYGDQVTFTASLSTGGGPLAGRSVVFTLPDGSSATATTGAGGVASVSWTVGTAPGDAPVSAAFAAVPGLLGASATKTFTTGWQHEFRDAAGGGVVRLNPATRDLSVTVPGWSSGRVRLDAMPVRDLAGHRVVDLAWRDGAASLTGHFDLTSGAFTAAGTRPDRTPYALSRV